MSGGTSPYFYAWSPSGGSGATAANLSAGNYTVVVTDNNGCTFSQPFAITQPTAMAVNPVLSQVSCHGGANGSITVTANGGAGGYSYQWSVAGSTNVASNLAAGTYTVTVTDVNGCTFIQSNAITQPTAIVLTPSATNILCNGQTNGTVGVVPQGGTPPYNYLWTGGAVTVTV